MNVALIYLHPLLALWLLDRELTRSRRSWRFAYRCAAALVPLLLGVLLYVVVAGIPYLGFVVSILVTLLGLGAMWLSLRERTTKIVAPTLMLQPA